MTPATLTALFIRIRILSFCFILGSCYKNHLYVQQEWVDENFLASTKVHTPDPRQQDPPHGQRLIVAWDIPKSLFTETLTLIATVRLWDNTEQEIRLPIERKRDSTAFFFPGDKENRILTYRVQIFNAQGEVVETWEHHFWTELIDIDRKESLSSAHRINDSVSSHPMQESVIETP